MTSMSDPPDETLHRRTRATMRDVAALAGVGIKTVSRWANGETGVSPATATRVARAASALRFQPDLVAGNLRRTGGRSMSLGLILASVDNPFCAAIHRAVEDVAGSRGVAVFSASTDEDPRRERALVAAFTSRRVDGLILTATASDHRHLHAAIETGTPVVLVDRAPGGLGADVVVVDNVEGAAAATGHLVRHGHRRVAHLGDLSVIVTARERHAGHLRALHAAGVPLDDRLVVPGLRGVEAAHAATRALLTSPEPPTALFTSQNLVTIGAIRALRELGAQHTVALVGFDDFALADLVDPGITVVAQNPADIGRAAAERVFARLADPDLPPERIALPTRLVERGSGEIPPPDWTGA
ncbi:LacI family DNA-binding transcriptional regulator [Cellulomonas sp. 179-A 4D5 NHS]|uniref:LacI family DNA-binding transcriptional regulator n=1 Tax=Cellulomonas sp. 179-A 4D5 NHS TaxID=3142378 RepID=UPI0039A1562E